MVNDSNGLMAKARTGRSRKGVFGAVTRSVAAICCAASATLIPSPAIADTRADTEPSLVWVADAADLDAVSAMSTPWGACGLRDDAQKLVTTFSRDAGISANGGRNPSGGTTTFKCGNEGWGYRHILHRNHDDQFISMAAGTNQNWREVADLGMAKALTDPARITYRRPPTHTFCYSAEVFLYNRSTGELVRKKKVQVVIGGSDYNVISAYPSNSQCSMSTS